MADTDVARVKAIDPAFDQDAFLVAATSLFRDVRAACADGNLGAITGLLAPPLAASIGRRLAYATTTLRQRTMSAIDQVTARLVGLDVSSDGALRAVVHFDVTGRLGEIALGSDVAEATQIATLPTRQWFEMWRLSRPCGAATPPLPAACPSCGAPPSGESHCHYCGALLVNAVERFQVDTIECMG